MQATLGEEAMTLKERWLWHTMNKAYVKAERDRKIFGTGFLLRKWWGWDHVPVESVIRLTNGNHAPTLKELQKFGCCEKEGE